MFDGNTDLVTLRNLLLILIPAGGLARILMCVVTIAAAQSSGDDIAQHKTRIKNTVKFIILAALAVELLTLALTYIGGI